jgi:hypothetical protein
MTSPSIGAEALSYCEKRIRVSVVYFPPSATTALSRFTLNVSHVSPTVASDCTARHVDPPSMLTATPS